ncbi:hypothetical protein SAMN02745157_0662 [Kaistia soli DSM 19436]|uniref:Uncharacterized protein n=1 Tax=Kaistia soli DSM 19436 TaxID=1122133 RepID=A0A1M4VBR1_9HYPH|nr:hypothetical protein [Kaistia soli]SHE66379.1 hypothetical protein SAMN02745157_0662 [Kaistia soli DSM 19436]
MSAARKLTSHEIEVLEMLDGRRPGEWGAWVGACLEGLRGAGYCSRGLQHHITPAGREALAAIDAERISGHA